MLRRKMYTIREILFILYTKGFKKSLKYNILIYDQLISKTHNMFIISGSWIPKN